MTAPNLYDVELVAQTTNGVVSQSVDTPYTEGELRDSLAGWLQFDWILEVHIKKI